MHILFPIIKLACILGGIIFLLMAMNKQKPDKQLVGTKVIFDKEKVRVQFVDKQGPRYYWISLSLFFIGLLFSIYDLIFEYLL